MNWVDLARRIAAAEREYNCRSQSVSQSVPEDQQYKSGKGVTAKLPTSSPD